MRVKRSFGAIVVVGVGALGFGLATTLTPRAAAHEDPCHSQHTCPSDHHTYAWLDLSSGLFWDCAEPGAPEYDPARDTTTIVYAGLTYDCHAAAGTSTTTTTTGPIATTAPEPTTTTTTATTTPEPEVVLPNPSLTPGAFNTKVRQKTISKTICVRGWTKKIRPPVSYTNALKLEQMAQYAETGSPSGYEEDHLIPLELGGARRSPKNLWPEPRDQADRSDPLETRLKTRVCRHVITLATARRTIRAFKFANG